MQNFLFFLGVLVFAIGCRTFRQPLIRKVGALGIIAATFLAGYFLFGENVIAGICAVMLWFFLPWVDILTRIRGMRLPLDKPLRHRYPPSRDDFPHLASFTEEVEEEGYVQSSDTGWDWDDMRQLVRVFYHEETKSQAGIYYNEQRHIAFTYIGISTRTKDGEVYTSWNFPFANTMRVAPQLHFNRVSDVSTFVELIDAHECYLKREEIDPDEIQAIAGSNTSSSSGLGRCPGTFGNSPSAIRCSSKITTCSNPASCSARKMDPSPTPWSGVKTAEISRFVD